MLELRAKILRMHPKILNEWFVVSLARRRRRWGRSSAPSWSPTGWAATGSRRAQARNRQTSLKPYSRTRQVVLVPALRIRDILVWIRIWPMDPDPDPAIFVLDLQDANKKPIKKKFFWLLHFSKSKKSKRSHKTVRIKIFLTIFAWWQRDPDPGGPKHVDPVEPDSEHWLVHRFFMGGLIWDRNKVSGFKTSMFKKN